MCGPAPKTITKNYRLVYLVILMCAHNYHEVCILILIMPLRSMWNWF